MRATWKPILALATALLATIAIATKADEAAIRKAYKLKNECFKRQDAKRLATTDLPTFHAIEPDGRSVTNQRIRDYIQQRFKSQVACKRDERPLGFKFMGKRVEVRVFISDDFTVLRNGKRVRRVRREHGVATWIKTGSGWRQESLRFTKIEWLDEQGKWQVLEAQKRLTPLI